MGLTLILLSWETYQSACRRTLPNSRTTPRRPYPSPTSRPAVRNRHSPFRRARVSCGGRRSRVVGRGVSRALRHPGADWRAHRDPAWAFVLLRLPSISVCRRRLFFSLTLLLYHVRSDLTSRPFHALISCGRCGRVWARTGTAVRGSRKFTTVEISSLLTPT